MTQRHIEKFGNMPAARIETMDRTVIDNGE